MSNIIESEHRFSAQNEDEGDHRPQQEFLGSKIYSHNSVRKFAESTVAGAGLLILIFFQLIFISYGGVPMMMSLLVPPIGALLGMKMFLREQEDELAIWPKNLTFTNVTVVDFRDRQTA